MIVNHNTAANIEIGGARQINIRLDARGDDNEIGRDNLPVLELNRLRALITTNAGRLGIEMDGDAARFDRAFEQSRSPRIELTLHQPVHQMDHGNLRAGFRQAVGRFQTEQSAADHNGFGLIGGRRFDGRDVAEIAERHHAGQIHARHVEPDRPRAGGQ